MPTPRPSLRAPSLALAAALALLVGVTGCEYLAVATAPEKEPRPSTSTLARDAKTAFRTALYAGDYPALPEATRLLTAAYLDNPRDPETAMLLGHAHLWRVSERARIPREEQDPALADELILAERYFEEARRLAPDDHRVLGWLGGVRLALGSVHQDERLTRRGYFMLREAVDRYPEFNHFSMGYVLSGLPRTDERFGEAVEHMWRNLDRCVGERVDRQRPGYAPYMSGATTEGPERVCWNGPKAPHNFEGFMLNFGDLLVKAGEPDVAREVYANARLSETYAEWPYREVLERRIVNADSVAERFEQAPPEDEPEVMLRSAFACTACHAR